MFSVLALSSLFIFSQFSLAQGVTYKVFTKTGTDYGAGTDGKVFIIIVGTKGTTSEHELETIGKNDFENGALDRFSIDDPVDVGVPYLIKLYRTNDPFFGNWQLKSVQVQLNGNMYSFNYNNWINKEIWYDINVSCSDGFKLGSNHQCQDINECLTRCNGPNYICVNLPGSYRCTCKSGYKLNKDNCEDINECSSNHVCQHDCVNTAGSYKCTCRKGFKLQGFNRCDNIDECASNLCKENTVCKDNIGSYQCVCKNGYKRRDFYSCEDINECITSNQCDFKVSKCINNDGGYSCKCNAGFKRSTQYGCTDIDECSDRIHKCVSSTSDCSNLVGGYYCKCKAGYHQGNDNKICMKNKCGPLSIPYQSVVSPSRCSQADSNYFGDVCTVACNHGYELENAKFNSMKCGANGRWEGTMPRCLRVKCPALSALQNGRLLPSTCTSVGNIYQGQCTYLCNNGYVRSGSPLRECQADKTWSGSRPTCIKVVVKPTVQCPTDIIVDLASSQKTADVSSKWKDPTYTGALLVVDPLYANAKYQYPAGHTKITWTAKNAAGSDSCSILVIVNDKEAPKTANCPSSPVAILTTLSSARVTWIEPTFTDNVGVTKVTSTHKSGTMFDVGSRNVYYTASDAAGNRVDCKFEVLVKQKGCPVLPPPHNGTANCGAFGVTRYCRVSCPAGKQIFYNPSQYSFWTCTSGSWTPTPKVPDCVAATLNANGAACTGNQVKMPIKTPTTTQVYCGDCPTGTYSTNGACLPCHTGQYQDQQGQSTCKQCPPGTSSYPAAVDVKQCRVICRPGHYAKDGMDPGCQLCPRDTYQDQPQSTSCKACPKGTTTLSPGRTKLADCGAKPIISSLTPKTKTIDERQSTSISCYASGIPTPGLKIKFRKTFPPEFLGKEKREYIKDSNGKTIGFKLTITGATFENTGHYECTAENPFGKAMDVASLTVNKVFGSGGGPSMDEDELL